MYYSEATKELKMAPQKNPVTAGDMFRIVTEWLEKHCQPYIEAIRILDYKLCPHYAEDKILYTGVYQPEVEVSVNGGGNEGVYIDWNIRIDTTDYPFIKIGTFKTLFEDVDAYGTMGLISGYIIYASDAFLSLNYEALQQLPKNSVA